MSKILFLTQVLPYPLNSGAKIRAYYVLKQLAERHAVTLVSFVREDDAPEAVDHLRAVCDAVRTVPMRRSRLRDVRAVVKAAVTGQSAIIVRDEIGEMTQLLRELVREQAFDVIHADQTSMVQYALEAKRAHLTSRSGQVVRTVLDAHNALYRIPERMAGVARNPVKRWVLRREARALQRYEAAAYRQFDHVVFVTEVDRGELPISDEQATSVIPICVDPASKPLIERVAAPRAIVHVGTMFWPPNAEGVVWFGREVFPQVLAAVPDAEFVIVGKNPPLAVAEMAAAVPNVTVTGYVAELEPYLARAAAFIVPLHAAGGMRVKIVDAWCWGLPIVSTTVGAEGIDVRDGENILIADAPEALADAVVRLLRDPALGERLRANGRAWVEARYDWRKVYKQWDAVYEGL